VDAVNVALLSHPRSAPPSSPLDPTLLFERSLLEHRRLFARLEALRAEICAAGVLMAEVLAQGGRLLFFGDAGTDDGSRLLAAELGLKLRRRQRPLAVMVLSADSPAAERADADGFARPLQALARPGDCAIGISSVADSPELERAFELARQMDLTTIALLGADAGVARTAADLAVVVPHEDSARVHEAHTFIGHAWCGQIEGILGLSR